ncbi:ATP-dependent DNA helicase [Neobacillus thermocopriae]|uniref:ATP-dependent DNA helicase n=1 Tax=Neobacillus thermocopriae TaxID=1215031 RepID=A0A6B3TPU0_9BACI|nr:ATP-dependent DNA helicase [Neobacillus thermocopriae]MED3625038.1 ATP-dependent DNA helicase [Neobacillus thermocopriae]MED3712764.1 ATP-dependent DNA helicase [Neobacillus thermocopriae]NEX79004.1 ATP-dependent DNA helicase [Neobacillus thermocopriae]
MQNRLPFTISKNETFYEKFSEWIGDIFYEILPEAGFELRDEQIYMAFQLEKAFKDKRIMFAEAGVGTGKTIVYLLYAIMYARYTNRPGVIACADETLIEQLVKKEGDITKLEQVLGLQIDVRLAKSQDQYLCLKKLDHMKDADDFDETASIYEQLPDFVHVTGSMQKFEKYGDRKDYPSLSDETWRKISWDPLQDCFSCDKRHRCGLTLNREYYRHAKDLIICSQDFYMEHIWTKNARIREGQLPLLPEHSSVVFDEGHLLEYAAQKALSYRFTDYTLENLLTRLMENDVREKTLHTIEKALSENEVFFDTIAQFSTNTGSEKQAIQKNAIVIQHCSQLLTTLQELEEELVFESEMYVINEYDLKIVEEYLDQITYSLSLFLQDIKGISWFEQLGGERTLVIMPRMVEEFMREEVFSYKKPYIFSSATMSNQKKFDYIAKSLGAIDYLSFSVDSPFDYEEKMKIFVTKFKEGNNDKKIHYLIENIRYSEGRALVLFNNKEEMELVKERLKAELPYTIYFEGDEEISNLVSKFQNEEQSVLCSIHLWEGLDIPGRSLENVLIYSLPFPPNDPVFTAKREGVIDPFSEVDLPYMLLRLRQGIGRLIRSEKDQGTIHILMDKNIESEVVEKIFNVLPTCPVVNDIE